MREGCRRESQKDVEGCCSFPTCGPTDKKGSRDESQSDIEGFVLDADLN